MELHLELLGEATGTIAADQMAKVVCTNTKTTAPPTVPDKTGSFKVKKLTVRDGWRFIYIFCCIAEAES